MWVIWSPLTSWYSGAREPDQKGDFLVVVALIDLGTENWWIFSVAEGFVFTFFLLLVLYFDPKKDRMYFHSSLSYAVWFLILHVIIIFIPNTVGTWLYF